MNSKNFHDQEEYIRVYKNSGFPYTVMYRKITM